MELQKNHPLQGGKYRIIEKIGQGGFAITYKASYTTEVTGPMGKIATDVTVAIKEFFFSDYCTRDTDTSNITISSPTGVQIFDKFKEKLKKEAAILSRLRHTNIVSVLDIFEENNTVYMVMEYVSGDSLKQVIHKRKKLDEVTALRYTKQLCDAVAEIHRNNVLHLDIKPGNILIDPNNNVKLIDFGISKQYNSDTHAETSTTPIGISKGFAPPEQYTGVQQFAPATDIYAIGATIYNMVSGNIPPESMSLLDEDLPPIEGISSQLWNVITRAMSPRRVQRPQSVTELIALLPQTNKVAPPAIQADDKTQICDPIAPQRVVTPPSAPKAQPSALHISVPDDKTAFEAPVAQAPAPQPQVNYEPISSPSYQEDLEQDDDHDLTGKWCVKSTIAKVLFWLTCGTAAFSLSYYQWLIHGDHLNFTDVDYFLFPTLIAMIMASFYVSFVARKEYNQFSKEWWIRSGTFVILSIISWSIWVFTAENFILQDAQFNIINILSIIIIICYKLWLVNGQKFLLSGAILGYIGMMLCCASTFNEDYDICYSYNNGVRSLFCVISVDSTTYRPGMYYIEKYDDYYITQEYLGEDTATGYYKYGLMKNREIGSFGLISYRDCSMELVAPCVYDSIRYSIVENNNLIQQFTSITIIGYRSNECDRLASGYLVDHYYTNDSIKDAYWWYSEYYDIVTRFDPAKADTADVRIYND